MACVLGLDIGTTSTIGILLDLPGRVLAVVSRPVDLQTPHPGWAEQDPEQWWANVRGITRELLAAADLPPAAIRAVGVTGMVPAVVLLDEGGALLRPSIQQSDGRTTGELADLRGELDEAAFLHRTGQGISQQLVSCKTRWVEKNEPEVFRRIATVFGSYDYINWRLTGQRAIEQNWALEGGLVDLSTGEIADDLAALTHLPRRAIPAKVVSHHVLGHVTREAAQQTGLATGTPVVGGAADFVASALGAGIHRPGDGLLKFGGAVDVLVAADRVRPDARLYLDYHLIPGLYLPNGCMSTGGSGLSWFARTFGGGERAAAEAAGVSLYQRLDQLAETVPPGAGGVKVLPYFLGEKTPLHDPAARGVFAGLSLSQGLGHLWRALLEAYAYAIAHHVAVLREVGHRINRFFVSDGGSASKIWMQIVADVLQVPLQRLLRHPGSCLGGAWTAAIGAGLTSDWTAISRCVDFGEILQPDPRYALVYEDGYRSFRDLYRRMSHPPESVPDSA